MSKYTCPACQEGFDTRQGKNCPHCGVEIKLVQTRNERNKISWKAELADPAPPPPPPVAKEEAGQLVSAPGEIPEIRYFGKVQMEGRDKKMVDSYTVTYRGIIYTGWVYCPNCWRKLCQMTTMDSGYVGQKQFCRSCQTLTEFFFITKSQWGGYK